MQWGKRGQVFNLDISLIKISNVKIEDLTPLGSKKVVSIIIVNYNGLQVLPDCLNSIYKQTYQDYEVILVDNASNDSSISWVRQNFPAVKLILNQANLGFAKACNQGLSLAAGKYLAFLNYDTIVDKDWLTPLIKTAEESADIGACMPKLLLLGQERPLINSSGGVIHFLGVSWAGNYDQPDNGRFEQKKEIAFASGAAMLVKKEVITKIGGFDEDFYMYCEDTDLSWRMRLAGYRVIFVPRSVVWHRYSFSKGKQKLYLIERNRLSMFLTNYKWKTIALLAFPALIFEFSMMVYALSGGWFRLKIKGYGDIIRDRKKLKAKRAAVGRLRKISDQKVADIFVDEIDFSAVNSIFIRIINIFLKFYWRFVYRFIK